MRNSGCRATLAGLLAALLALCTSGCLLLDDDFWEEASTESASPGAQTVDEVDWGAEEDAAVSVDLGEAAEGIADENLIYGSGFEESTFEEEYDPDKVAQITRSARPIRPVQKQDVYGRILSDDFYFYRGTLSKNERMLYDQIYANARDVDAYFEISTQVPTDRMHDIFTAVRFDNPDLFWLDNQFRYTYDRNGNISSVTLSFYDCASRLRDFQRSFYQCTDSVLEQAMQLDSDIDKVKYVHDLLTNINDYNWGAMNQSAYSAVCYGETVCMGYAAAFQFYMQRLGIPSAIINGETKERHVWNIVYLDGDFYTMDVTWDDPVGNPPNTYYYNYFNITDGTISKTHTRIAPGSRLPAANGTFYQYANYYGSSPGSDLSSLRYGAPRSALPPVYPDREALYEPSYEDEVDDADDYNADDIDDGYEDDPVGDDPVYEDFDYDLVDNEGADDFETYYEFYDWTDAEWETFWIELEQELPPEALAAIAEMSWEEFFQVMQEAEDATR